MEFALDAGNTAWMIMATALVLLMTPALAFFYGGMVRTKSVLNMMMMSFVSMGTIAVIWVVYGYGLAFGPGTLAASSVTPRASSGSTVSRTPRASRPAYGVPFLVMVAFQATFAIITVALISGSIADRMKFAAWVVFTVVWITLVYTPVAHAVWGGGILGATGNAITRPPPSTSPVERSFTSTPVRRPSPSLSFLGKRKGFGKEPMRPHNLPFVMLGAALLWFGWFGFNAGSEFGADATAGRAFLNTIVAPAFALLAWILVEKIRDGRPTSLGAASGIVAGLVAITPAAAAVDTWGALAIGFIAGVACALAIGLKYKFGYDDSLDVVGVHLVGGIVGTAAHRLLRQPRRGHHVGTGEGGAQRPLLRWRLDPAGYPGDRGRCRRRRSRLSLRWSLGWRSSTRSGLRVKESVEVGGIDLAEHGETAYEEAK